MARSVIRELGNTEVTVAALTTVERNLVPVNLREHISRRDKKQPAANEMALLEGSGATSPCRVFTRFLPRKKGLCAFWKQLRLGSNTYQGIPLSRKILQDWRNIVDDGLGVLLGVTFVILSRVLDPLQNFPFLVYRELRSCKEADAGVLERKTVVQYRSYRTEAVK